MNYDYIFLSIACFIFGFSNFIYSLIRNIKDERKYTSLRQIIVGLIDWFAIAESFTLCLYFYHKAFI